MIFPIVQFISISIICCSCNSQILERDKREQRTDSTYFVESFYPDGAIEERISMNAKGQLHGTYEVWHQNGVKRTEFNFNKGKRHGKQISWWDNGKLEDESFYRDGQLDGKRVSWWKTGKKISEEFYESGQLISTTEIRDDYVDQTMLKILLDRGVDSLKAVEILQKNLSGQIIESDSGKSKVIINHP
ncbi:MAG: hypothetical protein RJQ09_20210 [Cyclobacteriaceae bacterium]